MRIYYFLGTTYLGKTSDAYLRGYVDWLSRMLAPILIVSCNAALRVDALCL